MGVVIVVLGHFAQMNPIAIGLTRTWSNLHLQCTDCECRDGIPVKASTIYNTCVVFHGGVDSSGTVSS
ncbi:unnamed protein product [Larinioides sclopetarius]|uniref:Uncharacterized protein n=1 Tax=Larinioides sclopetarius TaxID=280406 RepID=A0AAV2BZ92_9ARAC